MASYVVYMSCPLAKSLLLVMDDNKKYRNLKTVSAINCIISTCICDTFCYLCLL